MDVEPMTVEEALNRIQGYTRIEGEPWPMTAARTLAAEVRRLSGAVPAGCVRDDKGVDFPVLGELPLTADRCVIGKKAYLWNFMPGAKGRDDDKPMRVCYKPSPIMDPDAYTDGPTMMWSTRAAAEAARERGGT